MVTVDGQLSTQGPASAVAYTGVPAYFACDNAAPAASPQSCFTCCRSACIVDSFAQVGVRACVRACVCVFVCACVSVRVCVCARAR